MEKKIWKEFILTPHDRVSRRDNGCIGRDKRVPYPDALVHRLPRSAREQHRIQTQRLADDGVEVGKPAHSLDLGHVGVPHLCVDLFCVLRVLCQLAENAQEYVCCWLAVVLIRLAIRLPIDPASARRILKCEWE